MEESAPKIDARSAQDIARQLHQLLAAYAPQSNWQRQLAPQGPAQPAPRGLAAALVGIFSRYSELVIQRLNKTPEKNLLAYLDLLGLSALPPHPARAPLTFFLPAGSQTDALVPAGTQVAAKPAEGDAGPVLFETERELTVVTARLDAAFTRDPQRDAYGDKIARLNEPDPTGTSVFIADTSFIEHGLYFSHERFLGHPALKKLTVAFDVERAFVAVERPSLVWECWDGERWVAVPPAPADTNATPGPGGFVEDNTAAFTKGGVNRVVFTSPPVVPSSVVGSLVGRWLRARLKTQLPPAPFRPGARPQAQLPQLGKVTLTAQLERSLDKARGDEGLPPAAAFLNYIPVDASKSFLPFGEKPRVGDALYLAQPEAFAAGGARVSLDFKVTRPALNPVTDKEYPLPVVGLAWEFWDGRGWAQLFTSELTPDAKSPVKESAAGASPNDETQAFTKSGRVSFTLPIEPARTAVNGVENFWVRVRIVSGDYGKEAFYKLRKSAQPAGTTNAPPPEEYTLVPASFAPPTVDALAVGYAVTETEPPDAVVTANNFDFKTVTRGETFEPFEIIEETGKTFYVGFDLPGPPRPFPNRLVSIYVGLSAPVAAEEVWASPTASPRLVWEYWDGLAWSGLPVFDGTADLTRTGILEFLAPPDFKPRREFGLERFWVRVVWASGQYRFEPNVYALRLNTVMAAQTLTVRDESLGSSDASAGQRFTTTATPVLLGQRLEVREPDRPSAEERARIEEEEGPDAVSVTLDETERPVEVWVRWHEVPDFYGSGPRDRHYVVNHLTGEFSFGDGLNGIIPPRGTGNLRLRFYQSGGGREGNRPAGTITELKTTIPYIDGVSNAEPAAGGANGESRASLIRRGPRSIRHRDRAVTVQDYEDLAMLASPEVARVKCFPLQDLAVELNLSKMKTGVVSLVVVPDSSAAKPYPSLELLDVVRSYLEPRRAVEVVRLVIVGPEYVRVTVEAEVVPESPATVGHLEANVADALSRFLHPLTGGAEGAGWSFGRTPHPSDIYAVIESVAGVGYVRSLKLDAVAEAKDKKSTAASKAPVDGQDFFLVYSGRHVIKLVFD